MQRSKITLTTYASIFSFDARYVLKFIAITRFKFNLLINLWSLQFSFDVCTYQILITINKLTKKL